MADKGGIQLLPETRKKIEVSTPGENRLLVYGFILALIIGGAYFGIFTYTQSLEQKIVEVNNRIIGLEDQRNRPIEEKLQSLSKQAILVGNILDNHIFMTQAISKFSSLIKPDVSLKAIVLSPQQREIVFQIKAATYVTVAKQIMAFLGDDGIIDYTVGELKETAGQIESDFKLKIDPDKYFKKK